MKRHEIVLTDVTAMGGDSVCVAGIDVETGETLRLSNPQPTRVMATELGFAPGEVIRVDWGRLERPVAPHVEDGVWQTRSVEKRARLADAQLASMLAATAFDGVREAFGDAIVKARNNNHGWPARDGARSLATIRARYVRFEQVVERRHDGIEVARIRVSLRDRSNMFWGRIPFQDLTVRAHTYDCDDCKGEGHMHQLRAEFEANRCLVRVGLTRPYPPDDPDVARCWLQVTNVIGRERSHFLPRWLRAPASVAPAPVAHPAAATA